MALAREAAADAAQQATQSATTAPQPDPAGSSAATVKAAAPSPAAAAPAANPVADTSGWRDELSFSLSPGQGLEIKLVMKEGEKARYDWKVQGGVVNYDTRGDGFGRSISYVKGRGVPADEGELVAAFTGNHGWLWRKRGDAPVTVDVALPREHEHL